MFDGKQGEFLKEQAAHVAKVLLHCASRVRMHLFFDSNSALCLKKKPHKCYLCEIKSSPSAEKRLERAQDYFNKKALFV